MMSPEKPTEPVPGPMTGTSFSGKLSGFTRNLKEVLVLKEKIYC